VEDRFFYLGGTMKDAIILMTILLLTIVPARAVDTNAIIYKGIASWYAGEDPGVLLTTANMEQFDDTKLTCAMWALPFNTILEVTNLDNDKSILVRVNDRGPAKRLVQEGRIIDLTKEAFSKIADLDKGLINVKVEIVIQ
jgi:rare lipoprotein A